MQIIERNQKNVVVFDLDNTIYNTWVERKNEANSEYQIYSNAKIFNYVADRVIEHHQAKETIIFLSSRNFNNYPITCRRVLTDFRFASIFSIILVAHPREKLNYIKRLLRLNRKITYYDDLAYGHETGITSFYDEVIDATKGMPIKYIGFSEIIKLQNGDINNN